MINNRYQRTLITAALPYANGPVHIGHLAGVYIPADIYTRYSRLKGENVLFVCGSDEHGVPISLKAREEGVSPQEVVDRYHNLIKKSFEDFGISFDIYSRTTSKIHHKIASDFFMRLYDTGKLVEKVTKQYYDIEASMFLADRYIVGKCYVCGHERAYGDQCESCGSSISALDLIYPRSVITNTLPELRATKHWYLPLKEYENWLKKWILEEHQEWKTNVSGQCKSWLEAGLFHRAVSRDLDWGIPVPLDGEVGKVLYVWFDAPIGYISNTIEHFPDTWEMWWKDSKTKLVHFIGKDNIVFHCIIFPVMLKAHGEYILPDNIPANEFLNLEGEKISTSRNWAVWLHEYLQEFQNKQDVLRYVLTVNAPEKKDSDFVWKNFQAHNNNELVAILGNFVNRVLVLSHKFTEGKVPYGGEWTEYDKQIIYEFIKKLNIVEKNLKQYSFKDALKEAMNLVRIGNKYLTSTEPWKIIKIDQTRIKTILYISLQIVANLSIVFDPFLPFTAAKIRKFIQKEEGWKWNQLGEMSLLEVGGLLNYPSLLFDKIEDKEINYQIQKLNNVKKWNKIKL